MIIFLIFSVWWSNFSFEGVQKLFVLKGSKKIVFEDAIKIKILGEVNFFWGFFLGAGWKRDNKWEAGNWSCYLRANGRPRIKLHPMAQNHRTTVGHGNSMTESLRFIVFCLFVFLRFEKLDLQYNFFLSCSSQKVS